MHIDTNKKIVVFDAGIPQLLDNKVFDPVAAKAISHTILPACYLYQEALKRGIQLVTPDIYFALPNKPAHAPLISNLTSEYTQRLIDAGVEPTLLACGESPFIATRFYVGLKRISAAFVHSFVFKGMKKRLSKKTIYHQMFFPQSFEVASFAPVPFGQKKFITMISGNKRVDNWKKNIVLKLLYGFGVTEIYGKRLSVIDHFSGKGFDLYGFGWDASTRLSVVAAYRGTVEDKGETLARYKFAFCLENSIFEGNVTEKIFDALFAACVPVYLGAPDIADYVPKDAFIDMRDFASYDALETFLRAMDGKTYSGYIERIQAFLRSDQYKRFSQEQYANDVLSILEESFNNHA
ncbi:hypothetical protein A2524_00585 [Candidatus Wolfebacteria bacterium RIFOXYD12_FULL_48_21]|uniref:Fucosyltransferase C-terminal domain-containing protein n=1 Tax=Candidatus Wolfebacteria bacterium RIFOXYD1_FULL_48_65 TaxID=1802561 RepID=A0A1F8E1J6_9BACT|nr:MAG: hypothetical protein A2610_00350 [Candidatus Wolfebacteria bacterium RIFOXYD1_FULL_48_65]OGM94312.1 MAG: hypothetical protein A2524_00585 [Candidatus Wolfebacteria bacterium RIFOXYD12_FULL_48_21]OGM95890.1 MAG: hypothetical protein A2532_02485 [Candidatus Wolfebacteria bacterium RIFOXYD2_FULL_48_11]